VDRVIPSGHTWDGFEETLTRSCAFICCRDNSDKLRECSVCGPVILSAFTCEIQGVFSRNFFALATVALSFVFAN
jgi:hypothetical protein